MCSAVRTRALAMGGRVCRGNRLRARVHGWPQSVARRDQSCDDECRARRLDTRNAELAAVVSRLREGSRLHWRRLGATGAVLAVFSLGAPPACADDYDTFNILAGSLLRYESNVFRVSDSSAPQSDTLNVSYIGASIDKSYSLQRVILKGT